MSYLVDDPSIIRCTRCVMDTRAPGLRFDANGVCQYCDMHDRLERDFPMGAAGKDELERISALAQKAGKGKPYDCVVGVSGGRDSSYCLYFVKEVMGLRPLAVHFDNGWDSEVAKTNIMRLCDSLDVELHTIIMDWPESRELTNANIRACVPYIDLFDDVGIANALYRTAAEENIKYIFLAHSFREEGVTPLHWNYMDGRYQRAIVKQFCRIPLKQYRNIDIPDMLYWMFVKGIRVVNVTNYYDDTGDKVERLMTAKLDWLDTGQHHMDNELFALVYYYARHKFGFDWRVVELSAKVRTGVLTRDAALAALAEVPFFENEELVNYCLKKQGFSREEFDAILKAPNKYFTDYPTYYPLIRALRWPLYVLCRAHLLPAHAYEKWIEAI